MADAPEFDPSKPYENVGEAAAPPFDPDKPYENVGGAVDVAASIASGQKVYSGEPTDALAPIRALSAMRQPQLDPIMSAFGHAFGEAMQGPTFRDEIQDEFRKRGIFKENSPFEAAGEILMGMAATSLRAAQMTLRAAGGVFAGGQAVVAERFGREAAAIPEAFMGTPHPMGIPKIAEAPGLFDPTTLTREQLNLLPDWMKGPLEQGIGGIPPRVVEARDLEVIGPPRPEPTFKDSPSELAERALPRSMSAAATPEEMKQPILGHKPGEYDERGKEWISKIDAPEDVREAIEKIAADHDFFPEARGGVASPAARAAVAEAAGINPADLDPEHFAATFDSDGKVRAVVQALRQTAKDFAEASKKAIEEPSIENTAAATEAEMRHTHVLEYTMGLRAESGRALNTWKELLRETERTKAGVALRSGEQTGAVPPGAADLVDAVNEVQNNLKTPGKKPGLQKMVDAAKALVDKMAEPAVEGAPKAPMSPEVSSLVDEAKNVLQKFRAGGEKAAKDAAELESFRKSLAQLEAGEGKISDTVEAARALLKKNEKPKPAEPGEPKAPSERGRLMGAAKRLVEAAGDEPEKAAKAPVTAEMQGLMEAARQAVGRLKTQKLAIELSDFRDALRDNDAQRAADAAKRLIESEQKATAAGQPKPPVEHDQVMAAARRVAKAAEGEAAAREKGVLPSDIQATVDEAKKAIAELRKTGETGLSKLVEQAEQTAANMTKQKAIKNPAEALPPELQGLVDKANRIVDRFGGVARGERAALLLARTGRTAAEQEQLARSVQGLTPNQVAGVLNKLRTSPEAGRPGWFFWLWQQGLISGLFTHTKYGVVNTTTLFLERSISPFVAAVIDRARGGNASLAAPLYANVAMVHALPDAVASTWQAFKTGMRVPLASEMRLFERGEESPQTKGAKSAFVQSISPDWGIWKNVFNEDQLDAAAKVLGIPGRSANAIHTFYKVLSEQASLSSRAFETAHQEGLTGNKFWQRYQYHLDNPTDDALRGAVNDAYSGSFMSKLGPKTEQWAKTLSHNPVTKWFFPFQHIPWNIERMTVEYSPFKILGPEMRDALLGNKGAPAQNLAIAKMAIGSSIMGYFVHKVLAGEATADYPTDPKERERWNMLRIQPNSIKIGGEWVSMERLGPIGNVAHMGAALGTIIQHYDGQDDDALTKIIWGGSVAAANQVGNEVGFQSLRNLFRALESEKQGATFAGSQASSLMYPSSFISQTASFNDPYARKTNGLLDFFKYRIPALRETLLPKRDPLYGDPLPNPGYHTIIRQAEINADPVKAEMDRLKIYVAPPEDHIRGVKLPERLYGQYQALAGGLVRPTLEMMVKSPIWPSIPSFIQENMIRDAIKWQRGVAESYMQMVNDGQITLQGMKDRIDKINGVKPTKLQD